MDRRIGSQCREQARNCNPYRRGRRFEYRTRDYLRKQGWYVVRQPRSMFPDLLAFREGAILLVECKLRGYMPPAERRSIVRLARNHIQGSKPILAFRKDGRLLLFQVSPRSAKFDKPFDPQIEDRFVSSPRSC
jgi:Holliday junction resolvase